MAAVPTTVMSEAAGDHTKQSATIENETTQPVISSAVPATETEAVLIEDDADDTLQAISIPGTPTTAITTAPTSSQTCHLLALPAELRNRIYRFALGQGSHIWLSALTWSTHQPLLLKTNRQIRTEALGLFYHENVFSAGVHDWDDGVQERFLALRKQYQISTHWHHHFTGGPHWGNLMGWLRGVHEGRKRALPTPGMEKMRSPVRWVLAGCFEMALYGRGMPWFAVERVLGVQRKALVEMDPRWGVDG